MLPSSILDGLLGAEEIPTIPIVVEVVGVHKECEVTEGLAMAISRRRNQEQLTPNCPRWLMHRQGSSKLITGFGGIHRPPQEDL